MFWIVCALCVALFIYVKLYKPHQYWKERGIPFIQPWPLIGSTAGFIIKRKSFHEFLLNICNEHGKEKYFGFYLLLNPVLVVKDVNLIKQIAIKDFDHFTDHKGLIPEDAEPFFGKNLVSLKGQKWKDMRSTLSPAFTSSKMRSMFLLISECADQFTTHFLNRAESHKPIVIEMNDVFTRYANDVIATCAFGIKCDSLAERSNEFYVMGKDASNFTGIKNLIIFGHNIIPSLMKFFNIRLFTNKIQSFFLNLVQSTINTRQEQRIIRPDMIHLLMEARKGCLKHEESSNSPVSDGFASVEESQIGKEQQNKTELSDEDITAQVLIFFLAGFSTSSNFLSFTAYELAVNPDIQAKLQKEIDETNEEYNGKLTYEALLKMKYLDMVISESLRKWPPTSVTDRICVKPYALEPLDHNHKPLELQVNDIIWFPMIALHRDPEYFPNPDKFEPERFSDENKAKIKPFTYLPFGVGPRNCIGSRFALLEAKTLIFKILSKFDIIVVEKTKIPLNLRKRQFVVSFEGGMWLGLKRRSTTK